jgi:hypothetical protein
MSLADVATIWSAVLWSAAYVLILRVGARDGVSGMPLPALLLNLSWEFVFSFVYPSPVPQLYANYAWLILDVAIAVQWLRLRPVGGESGEQPSFVSFASLLAACLLVMVTCVEMLGDAQGRGIAYSQNLLMSVLFIHMLRRRRSARGQSMGIAIFKMLGTLAACAGTLLRDLDTPFLTVLFVAIFVTDLVYTLLLWRVVAVAEDAATPRMSGLPLRGVADR